MQAARTEVLPPSRARAYAWLALTVLACYLNSLAGAFQFDDYKVIVDNPLVHSWSAWLADLGHGIRPLLKLSYMLNWIGGWGATGFHVTNLLLHLGSVWLVYELAREFVCSQTRREVLRAVPLLTALLFAAHPIHTEAISYISGRSSSLMTLFYLAAMLAYAVGRRRHSMVHLHALTPLLFLSALGVKETAITLPPALLLWELACGGSWKSAARQQWPSWALALVAALFFVLSDGYAAQMQTSADLNSWRGNVATQLGGLAYLLRQWAMPLWLNIDPDLPLLHLLADAALPSILLLAMVALTFACWRRRVWISFALAWTMLQLVPLYLLLPRLDVANERQMYLAGWPLLLALTTELALRLRARSVAAVLIVMVFALGTLTVRRNQIYLSEIALWEDTAAKSPRKARVHNNLGYAYLLADRCEAAQREFALALQLDPLDIKARYNLRRCEKLHHGRT